MIIIVSVAEIGLLQERVGKMGFMTKYQFKGSEISGAMVMGIISEHSQRYILIPVNLGSVDVVF